MQKEHTSLPRALNHIVVMHVPHSSTVIPDWTIDQFLLTDSELALELLKMTDSYTDELFCDLFTDAQSIKSNVSRLVVDVERFRDNDLESMSQIGMGAVYDSTCALTKLRRAITESEREALLSAYYDSHHAALTDAVDSTLAKYGRCLIIDCHSFPNQALPYERHNSSSTERPQICIGTDDYHSPIPLIEKLKSNFINEGFEVAINAPFSGTIVPMKHYRRNNHVHSVMIEIRRDVYMNEATGQKLERFDSFKEILRDILNFTLDNAD